MHAEAFDFVCRAANLIPTPATVLEVGARNVNGSAKDAFDLGVTRWHGVDKSPGDDVDVVCDFLELDFVPADQVDLVVCCEVLEHERHTDLMVTNMAAIVRDGGHLLITCATAGRAEHSAVDGGHLRGGEWYRNVQPSDLIRWNLIPVLLETHSNRGDLYLLARRDG